MQSFTFNESNIKVKKLSKLYTYIIDKICIYHGIESEYIFVLIRKVYYTIKYYDKINNNCYILLETL